MARFPALDPEPPPPSLARRLTVAGAAVAVLAVLGGVGVAVRSLGGSSEPVTPAASVAPAGRVVVLDGEHLGVASPAGGERAEPITDDIPVDLLALRFGFAVSIDGRRGVAVDSGRLVDLTRTGVQTPGPAVPADLLDEAALSTQPWTSTGELVLLRSGAGGPTVALIDATSARTTDLGPGVTAVGDPSSRAAVVATGPPQAPPVDLQTGEGYARSRRADRIELRTPGVAPRLLLTMPAFARAVGLGPGEVGVDLLSVSPDGRHVALTGFRIEDAIRESVAAETFTSSGIPATGLVVLDRSGRVVAARPATADRRVAWMRWSGTGRLAYEELVGKVVNDPDETLRLWSPLTAPRDEPLLVELPGVFNGAVDAPCSFSPDNVRLLCGDERGWYDVEAATGAATAVPVVPGRPLAWLPPAGPA